MGAVEIDWIRLSFAYLLLLIPFAALYYYGTGLTRTSIIAAARMTIQLLFVGVYLKYIFELDSIWLNLGWAILMIGIAGATIVKRSELRSRYIMFPVLLGILGGLGLTAGFVLVFILDLNNPFTARYFIPIVGMLLGNCLSTSIIGLTTFYRGLDENRDRYSYRLACGASRNEALRPFISEALKRAFNPAVASMATIGLIALPGMMTGQILGGSAPWNAIRYQLIIMIAIFSGTVTSVMIGITASGKTAFDEYDMPRRDVLRK